MALLLQGCHQLVGLQVVLLLQVLGVAQAWLVALLLVCEAGLLTYHVAPPSSLPDC